jgi:hypothetical protein
VKHAREDYNRIQDPAGVIPNDEPVFLLRGQDMLAPKILDAYACAAFLAGCFDIAQRVRAQANAMRDWQEAGDRKLPDL